VSDVVRLVNGGCLRGLGPTATFGGAGWRESPDVLALVRNRSSAPGRRSRGGHEMRAVAWRPAGRVGSPHYPVTFLPAEPTTEEYRLTAATQNGSPVPCTRSSGPARERGTDAGI
jgi:hypothetical protein